MMLFQFLTNDRVKKHSVTSFCSHCIFYVLLLRNFIWWVTLLYKINNTTLYLETHCSYGILPILAYIVTPNSLLKVTVLSHLSDASRCRFVRFIMWVNPLSTAPSQNAVTAYFSSKQLSPFGFAEQLYYSVHFTALTLHTAIAVLVGVI